MERPTNPLLRNQNKNLKSEDLIQMRHDFMCCYGWISIEEFKKIKIVELFQLNEMVQKEKRIKYTAYQAQMAMGMKPNKIKEVFN